MGKDKKEKIFDSIVALSAMILDLTGSDNLHSFVGRAHFARR